METNGLFIQRLYDLQKIRHLQKLFEQKSSGSKVNKIVPTSADPLVDWQSHEHLAALAAMSYWRSDRSQIEITMALVQPDKSRAITIKAFPTSTNLLP